MANKKKGQSVKPSQGKKSQVAGDDRLSLSPASIRTFIQEVQSEFKKVVWPDKKVTAGLTGFVVILVVVISIYLGSVDFFLGKLVTWLLR